MPHNENSRVKIPALVHFTRLGYKYISLRKYEGVIDNDTNILVDVLCDAINRINATSLTTTDVQKIVNALKAMLENDDLGREFYSVLINGYNGLKLIDFEDFGGTVNSYHVVTEMTCKNGSDEFRPDITPLINGIPLAFIEVKMLKGSLDKKEMYAHPKYVSALVEYITDDFRKSRIAMNDESIGGMIVCDSSEQARAIFEELKSYPYSAALILHDADDKETRKDNIDAFKKGTIDFLVVYNMLLTGFDAPRLKKLYLGRVIKDHNLLQALTRVNRPYKNYRYGYVVDFADIRAEFDKTNKAYFDELQAELGDEFKQYDNIFKSPETIEADLQDIKDVLFLYDTGNAEVFSQQISAIDDKQDLIQLRRALELYKELFNVAKLFGYDELADQFDLNNISALYSEVCNRIALINQKKLLEEAQDMSAILNLAMDEIEFHFRKVSEKELVIADKYQDTLNRTRKAVLHTLDPKDPEYITLLEELQRLLAKKNIEELTADEMTADIEALERIRKLAEQKNLADQMLAAKYDGDVKFMRTHKRLRETPPPIAGDVVLHQVLTHLKHRVDSQVLSNSHLMDNEPYFMQGMFPMIKQELDAQHLKYSAAQIKYIGTCISNEYFTERNFAS